MDMNYIIVVLLLMGIIGLFFGCVLAFANKKLAVEMNPLIHLVEDILPKGQCGSCGYAGCQAYAEAVVLNEDVPPNLCIPGKQEVALKVAELTGKDSGDVEPQRAYVRCTSPLTAESEKYRYSGITNCVAASLMHSGPKNCQYGCLGMGSCVTQCVFDAIHMGAHGLPVIDKTFCTGCGKCATICPKKIIEVIPVSAHVVVACKSLDKGAVARKICTSACIGCGLCKKQCPHDAITVENNLAWVNAAICNEKNCDQAICLEKCPTKAITAVSAAADDPVNAAQAV